MAALLGHCQTWHLLNGILHACSSTTCGSSSHGSSGSSGAGQARRAALRTRAYMTRHKDEQLQRTVDRYVAAINAHDIGALCAVLAPKVS